MMFQHAAPLDGPDGLAELPAWAGMSRAASAEAVAFQSGAMCAVLNTLVTDPESGVPVPLLANHLAAQAAEATSKLEGRMARAAELRDAFYLTPAGEARGPDGDLLDFWRQAARLRPGRGDRQAGIAALVGQGFAEHSAHWIDRGSALAQTHGPLAGCAAVLEGVFQADSRAERVACLASDLVLASALRWKTVLPVTAPRLTKTIVRQLVAGEPEARLAAQRTILSTLQDAIRLARMLARCAAALTRVAPKLRAKGAEAAVALFLKETAVSPGSMLSPVIQGTRCAMTDRAARRLCDRLVSLGVVHELTGRSTFRLYGIMP